MYWMIQRIPACLLIFSSILDEVRNGLLYALCPRKTEAFLMFCADIKSTVFRITAPGLSNRHVLFLCWKNYVSCYASTSRYSAALAYNSLDLFFFFPHSSSMTLRNGLTWEVALWSQTTAITCRKDTRSLFGHLPTSDLPCQRHIHIYSICYNWCYDGLTNTTRLHADSETIQACRTYSRGVRLLPPSNRVCYWTFRIVLEVWKFWTCNCSLQS